jgi:hypothetical protein
MQVVEGDVCDGGRHGEAVRSLKREFEERGITWLDYSINHEVLKSLPETTLLVCIYMCLLVYVPF